MGLQVKNSTKFIMALLQFLKCGSDEILGGYNQIEWKSYGGYSTTKDSFIFSFKNNDIFENHILSRVKDKKKAVFNSPFCGPIFGDEDLAIWVFCYCEKIS